MMRRLRLAGAHRGAFRDAHRNAHRDAHRLRELKFSIPIVRAQESCERENGHSQDLLTAVPSSLPLELARDFFNHQEDNSDKVRADPTSKPPPPPSSLLPLDRSTGTFPYKKFPSHLPTPYDVLDERKKLRSSLLGIFDGPERLSVSSLSPGWCELRKLYDIYLDLERPQTAAMLEGSKIHENLERQLHPVINTSGLVEALVSALDSAGVSLTKMLEEDQDIQIDISQLIDSHPAFPILEQITRLLSLFVTGHAREIRVLLFVDRENMRFLDLQSNFAEESMSRLVMVSGIIDHLIFRPSQNPDDWSLHEELSLYQDDLHEFLTQAPLVLSTNLEWPSISVSDIKTRAWRSINKQWNVLRANEFQVLSYRKFLGMMGGQLFETARLGEGTNALEFCYRSFVENMRRRQIDIDEPVAPELMLPLLYKNKSLIPDALRLKRGEEFEFPLFDDHQWASEGYKYELSHLKEVKSHGEDYSLFPDELFEGQWAKPFTIRFLLLRLSQFYQLMEPYLADDCYIEYLLRSGDTPEPFKTTHHLFKNSLVNAGLLHSATFYLTNNDNRVELINPRSFKTYCEPPARTKTGGCKYRDWCGWYQEQKRTGHLDTTAN